MDTFIDIDYYASNKETPESLEDLTCFTRIGKDEYIPTYEKDMGKKVSDFSYFFRADDLGDIEIPNPLRIKRQTQAQ
jgi:hypothetical protein